MTLGGLLARLDPYCEGRVLAGTPEQTCTALREGTHPDPQYGPLLGMVVAWCALTDASSAVERSAVVNALGPLRLELMQSDTDLARYRALNDLVQAVDAAFDDARLDQTPHGTH